MTESQAKLVAWFREHASEQEAEGHPGRAIDVLLGATELARRSLDREQDGSRLLFELLLDLGTTYLHSGNPEKAARILEETLEMAQEEAIPITPIEMAEVLQRLGTSLDLQGKEDLAGERLSAALEILEQEETPPLDSIAHLANNLGMMERNRGDFDAAATYYQRAQSIFESLGEEHALDLATVCNNQGSLCTAVGQPELGRDFHLAALKLRKDHLPDHHPDIGQSACNLAVVYHDLGDTEKATRNYERALEILRKSSQQEPEIYEIVSGNYATLLRETGQTAKAERLEKSTAKWLQKPMK